MLDAPLELFDGIALPPAEQPDDFVGDMVTATGSGVPHCFTCQSVTEYRFSKCADHTQHTDDELDIPRATGERRRADASAPQSVLNREASRSPVAYCTLCERSKRDSLHM